MTGIMTGIIRYIKFISRKYRWPQIILYQDFDERQTLDFLKGLMKARYISSFDYILCRRFFTNKINIF